MNPSKSLWPIAFIGLLAANAAQAQIFVADNQNGVVGEYTIDGGVPINASLISGLNSPVSLAVGGSNLYVASNFVVGQYTTSGATVNASLITETGTDTYIGGIAASGSDLFVVRSNATNGTIAKYNSAGAVINASLISGLKDPGAVAVSGSNLYVLSSDANGDGGLTVGKYTTSGSVVNAALITGLQDALTIAVSGTNLYVLDYIQGSASSVRQYTTAGKLVNASFISGLNAPLGIAVSGSNIVVSEGNYIGEYTTSGSLVKNLPLTPSTSQAFGIAVVAAPEPTTYVLMGLGLAAAGAVARRRRST